MTEHEKEIHRILMPLRTHKSISERDLKKHCKTTDQFEQVIAEEYVSTISEDFWGKSYCLTSKAKELLTRKNDSTL